MCLAVTHSLALALHSKQPEATRVQPEMAQNRAVLSFGTSTDGRQIRVDLRPDYSQGSVEIHIHGSCEVLPLADVLATLVGMGNDICENTFRKKLSFAALIPTPRGLMVPWVPWECVRDNRELGKSEFCRQNVTPQTADFDAWFASTSKAPSIADLTRGCAYHFFIAHA
jgi:hypothetical protein